MFHETPAPSTGSQLFYSLNNARIGQLGGCMGSLIQNGTNTTDDICFLFFYILPLYFFATENRRLTTVEHF
jgi:hypothetical protein